MTRKLGLTQEQIEDVQATVSRLLWAEGGARRGVVDRAVSCLPANANRSEARRWAYAGIREFGKQLRADGHG